MQNEQYIKNGVTFTHCKECDRVEVVRCRDCKHYDGDFCNHEQWWNDDSYITVDDDDFCSYGERKDQNG